MKTRLITKVLCLVLAHFIACMNAERKDGDYIIGAILPVHKQTNGNCTDIDYKGLAVSEAIKFAIEEINSDHKLLGKFTTERILGYDIRDSCGDSEKEKDIAYSFIQDLRKYKASRSTSLKPVSAVISQFQKKSLNSVKLLRFENIPQLSYDAKNVKLLQMGKNNEELGHFLSIYPEDESKTRAVADLIKELKFEYTSIMAKNDVRARTWLTSLKKDLDKMDKCYSDGDLMQSTEDLKTAMLKLNLNSQATVAVIYGQDEDDLMAFEEAKRINDTETIWMSTNSWREQMHAIGQYAAQVEGMVSIENNMPDPQGFKAHIADDNKPSLKNSLWYGEAINKIGSKEKLKQELAKYNEAISYAIDAVYTIANGIQSQLMDNKTSSALITAMKKLDFQSPVTHNKIKFTDDGNVLAESFLIFNMQGNTSSNMENIIIGNWKRENEPKLSLNKKIITWKHGSKMIPSSKCSRDCVSGEELRYPNYGPRCCWYCTKCQNQTISNKTNSQCFKCPQLETPNPQKTKCIKFKQKFLHVSNPMAEFALFLMVIALLYTFFCMFIFNQNKECGVMQQADNETMQILLFGIILILLSAIPLLMKPTINVCMAYSCVFNVALTIPLSALLTKTWLFRLSFYNSDDSFKASMFGSRPGFFVGIIIILLQAGILCAGLYMEKTFIIYDDTEQWDTKYVECSLFRGYAFWFSYGFNIALSVLINFFNCGVPNVEARFGEYNWLCLTACSYYAISFLTITVCFAVHLLGKVEGLIVITILHAYVFLFAYIYPKLHMVLFMKREQMVEMIGQKKHENAPLMYKDDEDAELMQVVAHAGGGDVFKQKTRQNINKVRIDEDEREGDDDV